MGISSHGGHSVPWQTVQQAVNKGMFELSLTHGMAGAHLLGFSLDISTSHVCSPTQRPNVPCPIWYLEVACVGAGMWILQRCALTCCPTIHADAAFSSVFPSILSALCVKELLLLKHSCHIDIHCLHTSRVFGSDLPHPFLPSSECS